MISETHAAWLMQRAKAGERTRARHAGGDEEGGAHAATVEDVVRWGTAGGSKVLGLDDVAAYDEPVEDQPTFEGNALLKARAGLAHTGLPSIADDSGLCVDALNGMPGVLSARWSGTRKDGSVDRDRATLPPAAPAAHRFYGLSVWMRASRDSSPR